jgi:hypothetical protein
MFKLRWPFSLCPALACFAGLRDGPPSTLYDRIFNNAINVAIAKTKVRAVDAACG